MLSKSSKTTPLPSHNSLLVPSNVNWKITISSCTSGVTEPKLSHPTPLCRLRGGAAGRGPPFSSSPMASTLVLKPTAVLFLFFFLFFSFFSSSVQQWVVVRVSFVLTCAIAFDLFTQCIILCNKADAKCLQCFTVFSPFSSSEKSSTLGKPQARYLCTLY